MCSPSRSPNLQPPPRRDAWRGIILGGIAGALFGVSDIALEFLTDAVEDGVLELVSPWTFAALAASVFAFYASARRPAARTGRGGHRPPSVAANLIAIVGGILVFRDSIGTEPVAIVGRILAFGLVVAGAAMIPLQSGRCSAATSATQSGPPTLR